MTKPTAYISPNVEKLLEQRYYREGETWPDLVNRVVDHIYINDPDHKETGRELILNRIFIPNSPCLVNAGKEKGGLMACFVVGPEEDTLENHFETLAEIAQVAKAGGGCGFTGSNIRAENSPVAGSTHGYAYGPNKFSALISQAMNMLTQSGFRRMALMSTLDASHPNARDFIFLKQTDDEGHLYNFNQSLMVSDDWMRKATTDLNSPEHELFLTIAEHAWNNGEPGLLFSDRMNQDTPYRHTGQKIQATNPCKPLHG